jgi:hypothetical protein
MLTDQQIEDAKLKVTYSLEEGGHHEHPDCIRIAYEWLDAQIKTKGPNKSHRSIKHYVEGWGGRYVSRTDVDVAAFLHPEIKGTYPFFNISSKLTLPSELRLSGIGEAHAHRKVPNRSDYEHFE